jgi:tetratricopeptide (TPR) repeat protein
MVPAMKTQPNRQPGPAEMQALFQLFQSGRLPQAEAQARQLITRCKNSPVLFNVLGLCQEGQGRDREAAESYRKALQYDPRVPDLHFNLGACLARLGQIDPAQASYRKALQLRPNFAAAHFNLGTLLQGQGRLQEAAHHFQQAVTHEPGFFAAYGNLGALLQQRGQLEEAERCYRKALALKSDARGHFNLATALHDQGDHVEAIREFRTAVGLEPQFADAWNHLGETLRDHGEMDEAIRCYQQALAAQPGHGRALYNLGEYHYLAGQLHDAVPYFVKSDFADAPDRALQCLYKTRQFEPFKQSFDRLSSSAQHRSILMSTLSTHYATNFRLPDPYNFCREPMDFVQHTRIDELAGPDSSLHRELLRDIETLAIAERRQGRLYYGIQSAGNLLKRPEASFQRLAALIRDKVIDYQQRYAGSSCEMLLGFPREIEFASSWYLRMKKGGHLTSHIHEEGWISGCVYLQLPDRQGGHEGCFEYSTDGDDYPRMHDEFPQQVAEIEVGDLVLFPSSLFHRTIPFHSEQDRVCVAFDIRPMPLIAANRPVLPVSA